MSILHLQNVWKRYRQGGQPVEALRGVGLRIQRGSFEALMGPSGSGKTTLLHLIGGLDRPDEGHIEVDGQNLTALGERERTQFRRRQLGIVFQQFNLIPTLSARQNIALPGVIDRRSSTWIDRRVDELLNLLGLSARADHRPEAMSGGEQQRVAVARAMLFTPKVLLADEPTGNLDSASSETLWRTLAELGDREGTTVLMVTHEASAVAHCRRAHVLVDGQVRGQFEVDGYDASGVASRYHELVGQKGS